MSEFIRNLSRQNWTTESTSFEAINCGSMLRIADAMEKMAQRHTELMEQRDRYERWWKESDRMAKRLARSLSATKGQVTKLKRKVSA